MTKKQVYQIILELGKLYLHLHDNKTHDKQGLCKCQNVALRKMLC